MKKLPLFFLISSFLVLAITSFSAASETRVSGSVHFKSSLMAKYMEKHGFHYIEEIIYEKNYKANVFGAKNAEVIIENMDGSVAGKGRTGKKGEYSIKVPAGKTYKVTVKFHGRETAGYTTALKNNRFDADMGFFRSEKVGGWLKVYPVTYCFDCDIRYHESKGSF